MVNLVEQYHCFEADMSGHNRMSRRAFLGTVAVTALGAPAFTFGQSTVEKRIDPLALPLDKPDTWTLHFRYKPPRIRKVNALDRDGRPTEKNVWYMWFQVANLSGEPQTFLPEFELVTKDLNTNHLDEPQPYIFDQLKRYEDTTISKDLPNGIQNIQTTIGISKSPIPPSKPDALLRWVSGIAIWTDLTEKAPKTNKFSVYITGLSNGLAVEETATGERLIKRKTLQINFLRPTDDSKPQNSDIVPDDINAPAEKWIYRTVSSLKAKKD
jgi:hypothetical protein